MADGTLVVIVGMPPHEFEPLKKDFLRAMSFMLHAIVFVKLVSYAGWCREGYICLGRRV